MNYSDAERMATVLDSLGYTKTEDEKVADLFVVIACSVRESAVLSIYGKVRDLNEYRVQNQKFRTILTGCVLEKDKKKLEKVFDVMMTMEDLPKLPSLLGYSSNDNKYEKSETLSSHLRSNDISYLSIKPRYESSFRAYVPISTGCDNYCSYCAVPYTKGREKSRPAKEVISEVKALIKKGYKEITLLGQNVNSYGNDLIYSSKDNKSEKSELSSSHVRSNNNNFAQLLLALDAIPGDHRIYFYSNHPKDMTAELIQTLASLKHFPHYIHLPLQSGNDEIIRKMNRHYTKAQYLKLVAKIRKTMPDVTLTTDIIVGYPGETEGQFQDTADVMRIAKYDMAFIAQYSPREGTVSTKQPDDVTKAEKVRREKILQGVVAKTVLLHNQKLVGTTQHILVDEKKGNKYFGRTEGYKVVEIEEYSSNDNAYEKSKSNSSQQVSNSNKTDLVGRFVDVKIESAGSWKLSGLL